MITNLQDYILHSRLFKTLSVDELLFVEYRCLINDHESDIWTHHNYLAYVIGGQKKWKSQNEEQLLSSGEALFIRKGSSTVYQYFEEPFFVLFIFLPDEFIRQTLLKYPETIKVLNKQPATFPSLIPIKLNQVLDSFFESLFSFFSEKKAPHPSLLKLKMEELLLNVLTQDDNRLLRQYLVQLGHQQKADLKDLMRSHFHAPLSIADFARLSARSLSSFRRDFKNTFNTTPGKWLLRKRLQHGKWLLETTDKTVQEVIEESGFKNRSHFVKQFKASFGLSPTQYRSAYSL